ncbi:DUF1127 domain-containing protein [Pseudomonas hormoni]|uniref:DUF1127 domain-containing protein n=1 Tax=Pseudomonas hormoni TaxID=3093767 RepID=A0ABX8EXM8_9PSED|nr:DUF1127 domain-containing protein [Pseudomonas hormoni]QVW23473.1 DUF1127 domain-containing protein [Pseudomonas hormoni]
MDHLLDLAATTSQSKPRFTSLRRLIRGFTDSLERARTRRLLAQLDGRQLSDLGISQSDRVRELDKPFWR